MIANVLQSEHAMYSLHVGKKQHSLCRATVVIPARNEEASLRCTLDALRLQRRRDGGRLPFEEYEVLLLLNNCTDRSVAVAKHYASDYPDFRLHIGECSFPPDRAHVGTARRALMDEACLRLEREAKESVGFILSTDADTLVAPDWIAANFAAFEDGADVVGGVIHLFDEDLDALDPGTRLAYERDRELQQLTARLEALLDPDPADPWPRHLEHFGASLACTTQIYRRSGGLPPVCPLEDVAFLGELRKVGAKIRHAPDVHVYTSARLEGRAEVGLSGQLRHWFRESSEGVPHLVDSAEWMEHRFATMGLLRRLKDQPLQALETGQFPEAWENRIRDCKTKTLSTPEFLEQIDCNSLIEEMFVQRQGSPERRDEITRVLTKLRSRLDPLGTAPERQGGSVRSASI